MQSFEGAILLVSHDRYFVDKIAQKLWAFEDMKISVEHLEYSVYLELEDERKEIDLLEEELNKTQIEKPKNRQGVKLSYKQNKILNEYPTIIDEICSKISKLNSDLSNPKIYQEVGLQKLYEELESAKAKLEVLENEYFEVLEISENE